MKYTEWSDFSDLRSSTFQQEVRRYVLEFQAPVLAIDRRRRRLKAKFEGSQESVRAGSAVLLCPRCGEGIPHRLEREGFLEKRIYSFFGFYPWSCKNCRAKFYLKRRYRGRRKSEGEYSKK